MYKMEIFFRSSLKQESFKSNNAGIFDGLLTSEIKVKLTLPSQKQNAKLLNFKISIIWSNVTYLKCKIKLIKICHV